MRIIIIFFSFLVSSTISMMAQSPNQNNKLSDDFTSFFVGNWTGDGEFSNGKKISADLIFKMSLDSSWITYEHTDKLPNRYKALSIWGVDMLSGQFIAYSFDNFHGYRKFVSDGWKDGKLILTANEYYAQKGLVFQHFIYEKISEKTFKMTYETSKDGINWKLGDYLLFNKK
jgi:hypothetical protein